MDEQVVALKLVTPALGTIELSKVGGCWQSTQRSSQAGAGRAHRGAVRWVLAERQGTASRRPAAASTRCAPGISVQRGRPACLVFARSECILAGRLCKGWHMHMHPLPHPTGTYTTFSFARMQTQDPELFELAKVGLGCLGVVAEVTLQVGVGLGSGHCCPCH